MTGTPDVLIVGGGVMGLAIALKLRQASLSVTVLSRNFLEGASHVAAGMLAPGAEDLPPGPLLDLCRQSLQRYPDWVQKLESLTGQSVGYWPNGILAPRWQRPVDVSDRPDTQGRWIDAAQLSHYQPGLPTELAGAWWYEEEGQVDPRSLSHTLLTAAREAGVEIHEGVEVQGFVQRSGQVQQVQTTAGPMRADHYVLATGAWSNDLLPIPVTPLKGQMAAVQVPPDAAPAQPLQRVLFGEDKIYIVPRRNGRIVLGATCEDVSFTPGITAAGMAHLFSKAVQLYPPLRDFPVQETWWGFRPTTPDEAPILGPSTCQNLTLATGHHRNGILLMPITAEIVSDYILGRVTPLLAPFTWQRFERSTPALPVPLPTTPAMTLLATPSSPNQAPQGFEDTPLEIAGRKFTSRLMTGTGKYSDFEVMRQAIAASGSEIVTVAVRRVQTNAPGHEGLAEALDWSKIWMLPNTAGCKTAEEAVRVARLGREMAKLLGQEDNNFVKLEVIPDAKYLLPDPIGTLEAAEQLAKEGFAVLPYINADPLLAKRLEEVGCVTVMPLGSPIGSGQGIRNAANIKIIIENANVPVVVDAGIGTPSEAATAMEMGADALLINTAIAKAQNPVVMGQAMGMATIAGRMAHTSGRIPIKAYASASSPLSGRITE
ncbi:glycine oxidase ThiO [Leptolyngbya iicbica LK]|uniref:Thiazole synthase n=2 Tax=Cyanophyceae TaxID=3028117 RepID=A0A4Q7EAZ2_9CYAN|nr:glycine oxidase ThiO [Leptolyngbya sp. LK]